MKLKYFWLKDLELVGRIALDLKDSDYDKAGNAIVPYDAVYRNGDWDEGDEAWCMIHDRLMGYDASEPDDSPYAMGNTDIMNKIEEITEEEAMKRIENPRTEP